MMTDGTPVLGSLHSVGGEGVVRMEGRFDAGIDEVWAALTDPARLAQWFGEVGGDLSEGGEFSVRLPHAGERTGRVEKWEPPQSMVLRMRDRDAKPGQPEQTVREAHLSPEGADKTRLAWIERGLPVNLLPAYGTGIQIHVEQLADFLSGRELRDVEVRWNELFPAYEALGVA